MELQSLSSLKGNTRHRGQVWQKKYFHPNKLERFENKVTLQLVNISKLRFVKQATT